MRALCGAIVTAGALIGLGLTSLGLGHRYGTYHETVDGKPVVLHLANVDGPLLFILMFLTCLAVIGLGITFVGLAYHHHRREREHLLHRTRVGLK